jgi:anti-sigma regulatory factor (Ser/Thr protein kinase)
MPLGLMPGMAYEEKETMLGADDYVLLYSDGLVEAHAPREASTGEREMFGFPRLKELLAGQCDAHNLTQFLLDQLASFTGEAWEQEDDVTLVTIHRHVEGDEWQSMASFEVPSAPGNEREAMTRVGELVADRLPQARLEKLKTAVAEATMNGMEHGNQYDAEKPVRIVVDSSAAAMRVRITDHGGGKTIKENTAPDLEAKLTGEQSPRGWGLFLIKNMVDEMNIIQDEVHHTVELVMRMEDDI